jgi:biopolymer transport protein ExbB/TolQ
MVGLCIAIPALVGNSYLHRRIELLATRLDMDVERLIDLAKRR